MDFKGLHAHIGSQVFDVASFGKAIRALAGFVNVSEAEEFSVGGGLGVAYVEGEASDSISTWAERVLSSAESSGITARILAEPGRSVVARAAVTAYTIGTVKDLPGVRTYVAVDGGMSDNPRPVLYGSGYEAMLPRNPLAGRPMVVRIVGKHCEAGDIIVRSAHLPSDTTVGDIVCTPVTGAYGHSMGSNYNKVLRPAVVFVRDGEARLVVERETYDDLLSKDVG
jgi:diaminopimelate decarboxylase